jgi:Calcineurin-like phosphoesterase
MTAAPAITGTAAEGSLLTASTGTWTNRPTSFSYQWAQCNTGGAACSSIHGQTSSTYLAGTADVGSTLRVSVTANNGSASAPAISGAVGPVITPSGDPVVVAVGDISCPTGDTVDACRQGATEAIARKQNPNAVFVLGDTQYDSGALSEYEGAGAYNSTWGFFNPIVHPVLGNHEYLTSGAAGYFGYFGQAIANPESTNGYYSFNLGNWHILALNSNCSDSSGCSDALTGGTTSAQTAWLQSDLATERAANPNACVLAMWHHPFFSAGWTLGTPGVAPLWDVLSNAHADIVLNGHDHLYERFAQADAAGNTAPSGGIREFVVGTGGEGLNGLTATPSTLVAHDTSDFGVLVLTLHSSSYTWKFVNTGGTVKDSGTTACNGAVAGTATVGATRHAALSGVARLTERPLVFDASPLRRSLASVERTGLPVAVLASRAVDVVVTAWLRQGHRLTRLASFYETESQIPKPHSVIRLRLPTRPLNGMSVGTLVLRFAAEDGAGHRHTVTRTVRLG